MSSKRIAREGEVGSCAAAWSGVAGRCGPGGACATFTLCSEGAGQDGGGGLSVFLDMQAVSKSKVAANSIKEEVLRDERYPVHRIADALLPYLQVLVSKFRPERVVLFGSYAYGKPTVDSDVDLLVVKPLQGSARVAATAIRKAFQPLRRQGVNLPFDIVVRDSRDLDERLARGAMFHKDITSRGITLV